MEQQIRIKKNDLIIIKNAFNKYFTEKDHLWLFGSRVELSKRGGDLDFYIETIENNLIIATKKKEYFIIELQDKLGDQKIDVVLNILSSQYMLPIYEIAKQTGIKLL